MTNSEIRNWAKEKIKGNIWNILPAIIVAGIFTNFTIHFNQTAADGSVEGVNYQLGWLFYFVEVGLTYFMVKFVTDQKYEFNDLFRFFKDFGRCIGTSLLSGIFIFLWGLLLIVPGIMKAFSYALVPYLLADDRYKNLSITDILKKSEEMMKGHRMDLFLLGLSFIGWHFLAVFTLFILEIWVVPYQKTATVKFLNDLKKSQEGDEPIPLDPNVSQISASDQQSTNTEPEILSPNNQEASEKRFCPNCGTEVAPGNSFCTSCGQKI